MMLTIVVCILIQQTYGLTYTVQMTDIDLNRVKESKKYLHFLFKFYHLIF
jgi:hypothetical protein